MGAPEIGDFSRDRAQVVSMDLVTCKNQPGSLPNFASTPTGLRGVRALVLVGGETGTERFGEFPLALLDVLGRSVLMRTLDRIRAAGVGEIVVLSDTQPMPAHSAAASCKLSVAGPGCFWQDALQQFRQLARQSECVLILRLGAWAEVDFAAMVNEHRRSGAALMRAFSPRGEALDIFVVSSGSPSEAAALLRGEMRDPRVAAATHNTYGYVNLLTAPADLRTLALDAFAGESEIRPCGRELRPGVWTATDARVHRRARIVAPAFIGAFCNVRRDVVVTRGSSLEHHSEVDCGTMIDSSTVLSYSRVGAGLDVEQSVVGFQKIHSLPRNATVDIEDPYLIGTTTRHLQARTFTAVSWLLTFLPNVLWKSLFEPAPGQANGPAPESLVSSSPALVDASLTPVELQTKSYPEMAATRRYGNQ